MNGSQAAGSSSVVDLPFRTLTTGPVDHLVILPALADLDIRPIVAVGRANGLALHGRVHNEPVVTGTGLAVAVIVAVGWAGSTDSVDSEKSFSTVTFVVVFSDLIWGASKNTFSVDLFKAS